MKISDYGFQAGNTGGDDGEVEHDLGPDHWRYDFPWSVGRGEITSRSSEIDDFHDAYAVQTAAPLVTENCEARDV